MREALRYLLCCLCLGAVGHFGSEALFWTYPPEAGGWHLQVLLTIPLYGLCAGAALSAALATGIGGWPAAFLGGALTGWIVEGAVVGTMYEAFPLQIVWTGLAWHALFSGLFLLGGGLAAARAGLGRAAAAALAAGAFGGLWSLYWPVERPVLPSATATGAYLAVSGFLAAAALAVLDRQLPRLDPPRWVVLTPPVLVALLFAVQTFAAPSVLRLSWPLVILATLWAMRSIGTPGAPVLTDGPAPTGHYLAFLLAPATTAALAILLAPRLGGVPVNWPVAIASGVAGLALWLALLWRAYRSAASASARSSAPS